MVACLWAIAGGPSWVRANDLVLETFTQDRDGVRDLALGLARRAFDTFCLHRRRMCPPAGLPAVFRERCGVFVSAIRDGAPRCCMGSLYPTQPTLAEEIIAAAVAAAGLDLRFPTIRPEELEGLRLVVSLVAPPVPLADPEGLDPVADGLAVRWGDRLGVALPGETRHRDRMILWARLRAGAPEGAGVEYFRVTAVRLLEPPCGTRRGSAPPTEQTR